MPKVIPTTVPDPVAATGSLSADDLAKALTERSFYVFGRLNTRQAQARRMWRCPPAQDAADADQNAAIVFRPVDSRRSESSAGSALLPANAMEHP